MVVCLWPDYVCAYGLTMVGCFWPDLWLDYVCAYGLTMVVCYWPEYVCAYVLLA